MSWLGYTCKLCDAPGATEHHVIPQSMTTRGYTYDGTVFLCRICHDMLHEETTLQQLADGGTAFLIQWLRDAQPRWAEYHQRRADIIARRKSGALWIAVQKAIVPKWKTKQLKKIRAAVQKASHARDHGRFSSAWK